MNINKSFRIVQTLLVILFIATISTSFVEEVYADECNEVLDLVNKERTVRSLRPLKLDKDLNKAASIRNNEVTAIFSHTRPDGSKFFTVSSKVKSENLAAGQKTPKDVVFAWMNSAGHKKNILNPNYTIIGISYKKTDANYKTYWVQLFGSAKTESVKNRSIKNESVKNGSTKSKAIYLEKVSGIKVESKKDQIVLKWNKQESKTTGYHISIYNSKTKNYQLLKKIAKYNTNNLIITGLQSSKTYKFQIKSFKVINKKTYYTSPSTITARTK
jgi:hypothetical protein